MTALTQFQSVLVFMDVLNSIFLSQVQNKWQQIISLLGDHSEYEPYKANVHLLGIYCNFYNAFPLT